MGRFPMQFPHFSKYLSSLYYKVWSRFASSVKSDLMSGKNGVVFFASVDVRDAFDSVNLDKLNGILERFQRGLPNSAKVTHVLRHAAGGKKSLKEVIVMTASAVGPEDSDVGARIIRPRQEVFRITLIKHWENQPLQGHPGCGNDEEQVARGKLEDRPFGQALQEGVGIASGGPAVERALRRLPRRYGAGKKTDCFGPGSSAHGVFKR